MSIGTMSKKRNRNPRLIEANPDQEIVEVDEEPSVVRLTPNQMAATKPRSTSYVAPPCTACAALRPEGQNYSRVETTRGRVRYCKCGYCGNTFKDVDTTA